MAATDSSLEERVEELARRVDALSAEYSKLAAKIGILPDPSPQTASIQATSGAAPSSSKNRDLSTILSTVATVCFLLVVALVLRTIVDSGAVNPKIGSYLGMAYAALLLAHSFRRYSRGHPHVPVYSTCGALLIFSIIYESQSRFHTLSPPAAYTILMATSLAMSGLGLRFVIPTAIMVGTVGGGLVGLAIEFPNPHFIWLAALVLLTNLIAHYSRRVLLCGWLRWGALLIAIFFWYLWTTKVRADLMHGRVPGQAVALPWMLPCLCVYMVGYAGMALRSAARANLPFGVFGGLLPIINVLLGFGVAMRLATAGWGTAEAVGGMGTVVAFLHFAVAFLLAPKWAHGTGVAGSFALAGTTLLALALPAAPIHRLVVLGTWSASALAAGIVSAVWRDRGLRGVSFLLQGFGCGAGVITGWLAAATSLPMDRFVTAALLSAVCFIHYRWSRSGATDTENGIFAKWDPTDRAAIGLYFAGLIYAFLAARMALYAWLSGGDFDLTAYFSSGQSVLINAAALVLLLWGARRNDSETLWAGFTLTVVGLLKVFGYDFLNVQGLPLVVSVFTFGVTAGVASLVWRRRPTTPTE